MAELLLHALAAKVEAKVPVLLDVPQLNRAAVALAERSNMRVSFETARMYRGTAPELPWSRIFGITSFEIG